MIVSGLTSGITGVAVDPVNDVVFFVDHHEHTISRADYDGEQMSVVVPQGAFTDRIYEVDYDESSGMLYWTNEGGSIARSMFDGTGLEIIYEAPELADFIGIAVDPAAGKLYWSDRIDGTIQRSNLDGSGFEVFIQAPDAFGIALGPVVGPTPIPAPTATPTPDPITEVKLTASDADTADYFGSSVAISNGVLIVGAWGNDDGGSKSGSAYIFSKDSGGANNWGEVTKLTASDAAVDDNFGSLGSIAISGDYAVVGAWGGTSAYVFRRDEGGTDNWGEVKKLTDSDSYPHDQFGLSVAISGDTVVVGAHLSNTSGERSGSAHIFKRDEGGPDNWGEVKTISASDAAPFDSFGVAVAISGDTIVVGTNRDNTAALNLGSAYIFQRDEGGSNNWGEVKRLVASDGASNDSFGQSVGIFGDIAIVAAYTDDDGGDNSGSVYIFRKDEGGVNNWGEVKKLIASDDITGDLFGGSVAISDNKVIVGATGNDDNGAKSGSAYIFSQDFGGTDNWGEIEKLTASDAASVDEFGAAVAISGGTVIVGAPLNDDAGPDSGSAYIYEDVE